MRIEWTNVLNTIDVCRNSVLFISRPVLVPEIVCSRHFPALYSHFRDTKIDPNEELINNVVDLTTQYTANRCFGVATTSHFRFIPKHSFHFVSFPRL